MNEVFCNRCGHRNPEGSRFCSRCGEPLDAPVDEPTRAVPITQPHDPSQGFPVVPQEVPAGSAAVVITSGPAAGDRYVLAPGVTRAGRHPDSDVFLDDITVSRRHAELYQADGVWRVRDVGSLNGTYLNRRRIDDEALVSGDELQIGKFKLLFLTGSGDERSRR